MSSISFKKYPVLIFFAILINGSVNAQEKDAAWYIKNAPFKMQEVTLPVFAAHSFSIKDYGGVGDGQVLNTNAFKKTIDACVAAGGGRVTVPAGIWLTGPIELKSNIDLHVERGALILFTKDHSQYPMIHPSFKSSNYVTASPIYGYDLKNIAITGEGIIDGAGESWRPVKKEKSTAGQWKDFTSSGGVVSTSGSIWWPTKEAMDGEQHLKDLKKKNGKLTAEDYVPARDYLRPYMLYLINCQNILLENITIRNSPKFVFYPNSCTNLTMNHVNIFNEWWTQNGDGIDISRCKNVLIYDCTVSVGDDGICMKSSGAKSDDNSAGLENVVIAKCVVYHAHGGFVIGSNTDGGTQNIFVTDCNFIGTDIGVRVKSNTGRGGLVKNIFISNIFMKDIVHDAISFNTYYEDMPAGKVKSNTVNVLKDKTPNFTDFYFDNIYCNGAKDAVSITGLPEMPVSNIHFKNMIISAGKGFIATDAADLELNNVKIISQKDPVFVLNNVRNININQGYFPEDAQTFIKADATTRGINVTSTDLRNNKNAIVVSKE
ncbi:glycoside hydrolase family 28 protein [Ginsengibacter hankyongi]|uniref:Glycoside hydrolase family 28 protein n=1 Tax=Ginsengibacter hankyongi TaxID=2607284 RepID=A0A5J5IHB3_9BACT|nr:glycoside hydrolase family 28 protein [Ginsengibacter hankyongi]KAA9038041.1 glycoside hydrolase family 28 protein [Ginsengibacter hankyongi]